MQFTRMMTIGEGEREGEIERERGGRERGLSFSQFRGLADVLTIAGGL